MVAVEHQIGYRLAIRSLTAGELRVPDRTASLQLPDHSRIGKVASDENAIDLCGIEVLQDHLVAFGGGAPLVYVDIGSETDAQIRLGFLRAGGQGILGKGDKPRRCDSEEERTSCHGYALHIINLTYNLILIHYYPIGRITA